jgi:hypothetical protein
MMQIFLLRPNKTVKTCPKRVEPQAAEGQRCTLDYRIFAQILPPVHRPEF